MIGLRKSAAPRLPILRADMSAEEVIDAFAALLASDELASLFLWRQNGTTRNMTRQQVLHAVIALKDWLIERRVEPRARIAIASESGPEWCLVFLAALLAGCVVVPIDSRSTADEMATIFNHAEPALVFASEQVLGRINELAAGLHVPPEVVPIHATNRRSLFEEMLARPGAGQHQFPIPEINIDSVAVISYTSGTCGNPKGVMLSFRSVWFEVVTIAEIFKSGKDHALLSMLPLNHMLELSCGFLAGLFIRAKIVFARSLLPTEIMDLMREHRIDLMVTVPLFLEQLHKGIMRSVAKKPVLSRVFPFLLRLAAWLPSVTARRLLFHSIHKQFGGRLSSFMVGGAPLTVETGAFFSALGINVFQGFGLTETSPVVSVNRPGGNRLGSVGLPLRGVAVNIVPTDGSKVGEILVKGPNVMLGYYRDEGATAAAFTPDGWFRTGDLGYLDPDGFLWLTGREKNLIVLPGGKKVYPEEVEAILARCATVSKSCVMGCVATDGLKKGMEEVIAVIFPNGEGATDKAVLAKAVDDEIAKHVTALADYKRPSRVIIYDKPWPTTAALKIRRAALLQQLHQEGLLS